MMTHLPPDTAADDPVDAPPDDAPEDARMTILRLQLAELRRQKRACTERLRELDCREQRLAVLFERNFPGAPFLPAPKPWSAFSYPERLTLHFIARRGGVRRVRLVAEVYTRETGDVVTPDGWAARICDLRDKGALDRGARGWTVTPEFAALVRDPPQREETVQTGMPAVARRAREESSRESFRKLERRL